MMWMQLNLFFVVVVVVRKVHIVYAIFVKIYESKLELSRSFNGDGGLDTELELLATLCLDPPVIDCLSTTYIVN